MARPRIACYRNINAGRRDMSVFVWSVKRPGEDVEHAPIVYLRDVVTSAPAGGCAAIRKRAADAGRDVGRNVYARLHSDDVDADWDSAPNAAWFADEGFRPLTLSPFKEGVYVWADEPLTGETAMTPGGASYTPRRAAPATFDEVWLTPVGAFAR